MESKGIGCQVESSGSKVESKVGWIRESEVGWNRVAGGVGSAGVKGLGSVGGVGGVWAFF